MTLVRRPVYSVVSGSLWPQTTESTSLSDAPTSSAIQFRTGSESIPLSDSVAKTTFASTSDTAHGTDSLSSSAAHARTGSDSSVFSDVASRATTDPRSISESTTTSDSAARGTVVMSRSGTDTAHGTDSLSSLPVHPRTASDTTTTSDSAARGTAVMARTGSDTAHASESLSSPSTRSRTSSDTTTTSDAASPKSTHPRTGTDTTSLSDSAARGTATMPRSGSDTAHGTDSLSTSDVHPRTGTDSTYLSDTASPGTTHPRTTSEAAHGTDSTSSSAAHPRGLSESISLGADTASRGTSQPRTGGDNLSGLAEDVSGSYSVRSRTSTDTTSMSDSGTGGTIRGRTASDDVSGLSDSLGQNSVVARSLVDTVIGKATRNRLDDLSRWTLVGASLDSTGTVVSFGSNGSATSPLADVDDTSAWWFSAEAFASGQSVTVQANYFQADGVTPATNSSGSSSDTETITPASGTWSDRVATGWNVAAGGTVAYVQFVVSISGATASPSLVGRPVHPVLTATADTSIGQVQFRNPMLNVSADQGYTPYVVRSSDATVTAFVGTRTPADSAPATDAARQNTVRSRTTADLAPADDQNLIPNPSALLDLTGIFDSPSYDNTNITINRVTGLGITGGPDTGVEISILRAQAAGWGYYVKWQTDSVKAGTNGTIEFWARGTAGAYSTLGAQVANDPASHITVATQNVTLTSAWQKFTLNFTTTGDIVAGTDFLRFAIGGAANPLTFQITGVRMLARAGAYATHPRTGADTTTLSDAASRGTATHPRSASEALTLADAATQTQVGTRTASEALSLSESATRGLADARSAADPASASDGAAPQGTYARSIADTTTTAEALTWQAFHAATGTDTLSCSDAASRALSLPRTASDTVLGKATANRIQTPNYWTINGATVDGSGVLSLGSNGSAVSTLVPVDDATDWWFSAEAYSTGPSLTVQAQYLQADRVSPATNSNGASTESETITPPNGAWSDRVATGWHSQAGGNAAFIRFVVSATGATTRPSLVGRPVHPVLTATTDTNIGQAQFRFPMLNVTAAGGYSPYAERSFDAAARATVDARTAADTTTISDSAARKDADTRTGADTAHGTDASTRALALPRSSTDTAHPVDSVGGSFAGHPRTASDTTTLSDSAVRGNVTPGRYNTESAPATDTATRADSLKRGGTDTIPVSESLVRGTTDARTLTDAASGTDATSRIILLGRAPSEQVQGTDSVSRANSTFLRGPTESVVGAVTRNRLSDFPGWTSYGSALDANGNPALGASGGLLSPLVPVGDTDYWWFSLEFYSDVDTSAQVVASYYQSDGVTPATNSVGYTSETKTYTLTTGAWSDRVAQGWNGHSGGNVAFVRFFVRRTGASTSSLLRRPLATPLGGARQTPFNRISVARPMLNTTVEQGYAPFIAQSFDQAVGTPNRIRSAADSTTLADTGAEAIGRFRTATDTTTLTDSNTGTKIPGRRGSDTLTTTDVATRLGKMTAPVSESLTVSDAANRRTAVPRSANDLASITGEAVVSHVNWARLGTDTTALADGAGRLIGFGRSGAEVLKTVEATRRVVGRFQTVAEQVYGDEGNNAGHVVSARRALADLARALDAAGQVTPNHFFTADAAPAQEQSTTLRDRRRTAYEVVRVREGASVQANRTRAEQEHLSTAEVIEVVFGLARDTSETLALADAATKQMGLRRTPADRLRLRDLATRTRARAGQADDLAAIAETLLPLLTRIASAGDSAPALDGGKGALPYLAVASDAVPVGDAVLTSLTLFTPFGPPVVLSVSLDTQRVSPVAGHTRAVLTFTFDQAVQAWSVRLGATGPFDGRQVAGWSGPAQANGSAVIEAADLLPGANDISVYGYARGRWTDSLVAP